MLNSYLRREYLTLPGLQFERNIRSPTRRKPYQVTSKFAWELLYGEGYLDPSMSFLLLTFSGVSVHSVQSGVIVPEG